MAVDPKRANRTADGDPGRCVICGYELRGNRSGVCPECGTPVSSRLTFTEPETFGLARRVLGEANLVTHAAVGHAYNDVVSVAYSARSKPVGLIWVPLREVNRAFDVLEAHDIPTRRTMRPIQDRSMPACPACGGDVRADGPARCTHCDCQFTRGDIEEPAIDTTGLLCAECGYNLTGVASGRCPECGALFPVDLDALVARAGADEVVVHTDDAESAQSRKRPSAIAFFLVWFAIPTLVLILAVDFFGNLIAAIPRELIFPLALCVLSLSAVLIALRIRRRGRSSSE